MEKPAAASPSGISRTSRCCTPCYKKRPSSRGSACPTSCSITSLEQLLPYDTLGFRRQPRARAAASANFLAGAGPGTTARLGQGLGITTLTLGAPRDRGHCAGGRRPAMVSADQAERCRSAGGQIQGRRPGSDRRADQQAVRAVRRRIPRPRSPRSTTAAAKPGYKMLGTLQGAVPGDCPGRRCDALAPRRLSRRAISTTRSSWRAAAIVSTSRIRTLPRRTPRMALSADDQPIQSGHRAPPRPRNRRPARSWKSR